MTKKTIVSIILVLVITLGLCLLISGCDSASNSPHVVREEVSGERYESIYVQIKYWSQWAEVESYKIYDNDTVEIVLVPKQSHSYINEYGNIVVASLDSVNFWHKEKNQSISS